MTSPTSKVSRSSAANIRSQACSYLRNGKVTVTRVAAGDGPVRKPETVVAIVDGNSAQYVVVRSEGSWGCTCEKPAGCAHVAAVQLVTGHDGLARKPGESR